MLMACHDNPSVIKLKNDKHCRPLQVKTGQEVIVSLKGNHSTGYRWLVVNQPHFLSLIEEKNEENSAKTTQRGKPEKNRLAV